MIAEVNWEGEESMSINNITGFVRFTQRNINEPVVVSVEIQGLPNGFHGFHIHEKKIEDFGDDVMECCDKLGIDFNEVAIERAKKVWSYVGTVRP